MIRDRIILVFGISLLAALSCVAQEGDDRTREQKVADYKARADTMKGKDLIDFYYKVSDVYWNVLPNLDSQQYYIHLGQGLAEEYGHQELFAYGQMLQGDLEKIKGDFEQAAATYADGGRRYAELGDSLGMAIILTAEAGLASVTGAERQYVEKSLAAARLFQQLEHWRGAGICYVNLGIRQNKIENFQKAEEYYLWAYTMRYKITNKARGQLLLNLAVNYLDWYQNSTIDTLLPKVEVYLEEGQIVADSLGFPKLNAQFLLQRILLAEFQDEYGPQLKPAIDSALVFARQSENQHILSEVFQIKAKWLLANRGNLKLALSYADSAVIYAEDYGRDYITRNAYRTRYEIAKARGDFESALADFEKYTIINDTIVSADNLDRINRLEAEFELEQKEAELLLLRQGEQLHLTRISRWRWLAIAAVVLALLSSGLIYSNLRRRQVEARNRTMEVEQQLFRAQMNPHFLFNSLNSIKRIYNEGRTEEANDFLVDFSQLIREILDRSNKTYVSIEEEVAFLKLYLDLEGRRLKKRLNFRAQIDPTIIESGLTIPSLILQPLVENSLWHGITQSTEDGIIELQIEYEDDYVICYVRDNGIGYETARKRSKQVHQSRGMNLIRQRIGEKGELLIYDLSAKVKAAADALSPRLTNSKASSFSHGTEVVLKIPMA